MVVPVLDTAQSTDTATTPTGVLAASSSDDDVDDKPSDVLAALALASLNHAQIRHLFALCVGDQLAPSMSTILQPAVRGTGE